MKPLKTLFITLIAITLFSCQKCDEVNKVQLRLEYVEFETKTVLMSDVNNLTYREVHFDETLFQMTYVQLLQLRGRPIFTFYECDGLLYHT